MKITKVIMDTGPLVALIDRREENHAWVTEKSKSFAYPWVVCEPVLTEAWHILRRHTSAQQAIFTMLAEGLLSIDFSLRDEVHPVRDLCQKYGDLPMSLADACLVRIAEEKPEHVICTLDRDFLIYRRLGKTPLKLIAPFEGT